MYRCTRLKDGTFRCQEGERIVRSFQPLNHEEFKAALRNQRTLQNAPRRFPTPRPTKAQ